MSRRSNKGTPAERYFVWTLGVLSGMIVFFWTQSLIPFNDISVIRQWVESIIPSVIGFLAGINLGYTIVMRGRK
jgi:hypothetical protein